MGSEDDDAGVECELCGEVVPREAITGWYSRAQTGAYYTPEEIVAFMVEKTIHSRLLDRLGVADDCYTTVDEWVKSTTPAEAKNALAELDDLSVCDPACGSGHFLVGALDEIVRIRQLLRTQTGDEVSEWRLARRTAESNIYGVDIMEEAVEIAKLRIRLRVLEALPESMAERYVAVEEPGLVSATGRYGGDPDAE